MMLAQMENVSGESLKNFLLIVAGIAATAYYIKEMFWGAEKAPPQPFQTQKIWPSATIKEVEQVQAEMQRRLSSHDTEIAALREMIRVELPAMERRINAANEERSVNLHNRINEVLESVSELRGEVKASS